MGRGMPHQAAKNGRSLCSHYRETTLLSIPGKVFNRVLRNRLKEAVDPHIRQIGVNYETEIRGKVNWCQAHIRSKWKRMTGKFGKLS